MSSKDKPGTLPTSAYTRSAPKAEILDIREVVRGAEDQQLQCDPDEIEVVVLSTVDFDTDGDDAEQDAEADPEGGGPGGPDPLPPLLAQKFFSLNNPKSLN